MRQQVAAVVHSIIWTLERDSKGRDVTGFTGFLICEDGTGATFTNRDLYRNGTVYERIRPGSPVYYDGGVSWSRVRND